MEIASKVAILQALHSAEVAVNAARGTGKTKVHAEVELSSGNAAESSGVNNTAGEAAALAERQDKILYRLACLEARAKQLTRGAQGGKGEKAKGKAKGRGKNKQKNQQTNNSNNNNNNNRRPKQPKAPSAAAVNTAGFAKKRVFYPHADVSDINAIQARMEKVTSEHGMDSSAFCQAPSDYYSWTLEQRRDLLKAPHIDHLCKSMVMVNTRCKHDDYTDPNNSKYYVVVVQYTAKMQADKLSKLVRNISGGKLSRKEVNLRACPGEISERLSGFGHNAVTCVGMTEPLPIILSDKLLQFQDKEGGDYMWLGGGHVDLKWRVSIRDFIEQMNPIVADITA